MTLSLSRKQSYPLLENTCFNLILISIFLLDYATIVSATNLEGEAWLGQKRKKTDKGVSELPSGLLYRVKDPGTGKFYPSFDTYCNVDYEITLIDGTPVESTRGEQQQGAAAMLIRPDDSFPAIKEALQLMVDGAWWELYVPSHLGYDSRTNRDIRQGEALMITLSLNSVLQGDKIPVGEVHNCFVQLDDDQSLGFFHVKTTGDCQERDQEYIEKITSWDNRAYHIREELARLRGMLSKKSDMRKSLSFWVRRRIHLLKQFLREDMRMCTVKYVPQEGSDESTTSTILQPTDCNYKEQEYIEKVQDWELSKLNEEIHRLSTYEANSSMEAELASWVRKRVRILNQISRQKPTATSSVNETTEEAEEEQQEKHEDPQEEEYQEPTHEEL